MNWPQTVSVAPVIRGYLALLDNMGARAVLSMRLKTFFTPLARYANLKPEAGGGILRKFADPAVYAAPVPGNNVKDRITGVIVTHSTNRPRFYATA